MILISAVAAAAGPSRAEDSFGRPDLSAAKAIATCKLQAIGQRPPPPPVSIVEGLQSPVLATEAPLDNYERTELGDWRMPAEAAATDPWIRVLVLGPKRPTVIDVAVFIDGKAFRESREAWIDGLLSGAVGGPTNESESTPEPSDDPSVIQSSENTTGVAAQRRADLTMRQRLANYVAASGTDVDREEIRWLIAESGPGPELITLSPALSWQHAGVAILEALVDADGDGALSAEEIAKAGESLKRADLDANDVVEVNEIRRAAKSEATVRYPSGHSPIVMVDAKTDWEALAATMARLYTDGSGEGLSSVKSREELREMCMGAAGISLRVDFSASAKESAGVAILEVSEEIAEAKEAIVATEDVISITIDSDSLDFCATSGSGPASSGRFEAQISVGAVMEPNPLMRLLDRDQDQRLTARERQELDEVFAALDRNGDGMLAAAEMPAPIRIGIALGPNVHTLLAKPNGAARAIAPRDDVAAPEWFAGMDKNGDRDLSREEFLGTTEQFEKFDSDGDGLLNVSEALKPGIGQ